MTVTLDALPLAPPQGYHWRRHVTSVSTPRTRQIRRDFGLTDRKFASTDVIRGVVLPAEGITYVTGYSGSGKSTLLRLFVKTHPEAVTPAAPASDAPLIELFGGDVKEAVVVLGRVGLGEAFVYLTPYAALSDGQKVRVQLALTLAAGSHLVVVDEFLSNLDRLTAKMVAYNFQKVCRQHGIAAVVATAHDDLTEALAPDRRLTLDFHGEHEAMEQPVDRAFVPELTRLVVERGTLADYDALSRYHYFPDCDLAEIDHETDVLVIRHERKPVGVNILIAPYPREWEVVDSFAEVNQRLRIAHRTVLHPVFRGVGLATRLCDPRLVPAPFVLSRSAMGRFQPFLLSAGYRRVKLVENRRTDLAVALEAALGRLGIEGDLLHDEDHLRRAVERIDRSHRQDLERLSAARYAELLCEQHHQYRNFARIAPLDHEDRCALRDLLAETVRVLTLEELLGLTGPLLMQGFLGVNPVPPQSGPARREGR